MVEDRYPATQGTSSRLFAFSPSSTDDNGIPLALDAAPGAPDHHQVQTDRRCALMQIKPIIAAAGVIALMLLGYPAVAAEAARQSGAAIEQDPEARLGDQHAMKAGRPGTSVAVHNTRPRNDHHKDARKCLNAGNNAQISSCAHKYR
jgi:hypothetical protein